HRCRGQQLCNCSVLSLLRLQWRIEQLERRKMTRTELIVQLLKIAIGLVFGAYFVWWSLQVLDRLTPDNDAPTAVVARGLASGRDIGDAHDCSLCPSGIGCRIASARSGIGNFGRNVDRTDRRRRSARHANVVRAASRSTIPLAAAPGTGRGAGRRPLERR